MSSVSAVIPLQLDKMKEERKSELLELLESLRGRKCMVLDPLLSGLLNHIILEGSKLLKDYGVQYLRQLRDEPLGEFISETGSRDNPDHIIYFVRPSLLQIKILSKQISSSIKNGTRGLFHVYFIPHRSVVCEQYLEDEGLLPSINIGEYHLGFVPIDSDLMSLELPDVFKQCYIEGVTSSLHTIAYSLLRLQMLYGIIPNIKSKGAAARKIVQKLLHLRRDERPDLFPLQGEIDTLIIIDREVDLISPLVVPLTYEGLVDELINIDLGRAKVDYEIIGEDEPLKMPTIPGQSEVVLPVPPKRSPGDKLTLSLNNKDPLFSEIRNLSIERLGVYLQEKAISIKSSYNSFRENKDASLSEIHGFVKKMPALAKEYKALTQHINIAQHIKTTTDSRDFREQWQVERGILEGETQLDYIEDLIALDVTRVSLHTALRLLCLQSITSGGIRSNRYDPIRRLIIHMYGYQHTYTLLNLERAGMLKKRDMVLVETSQQAAWAGLRKQLRLINERVNMSRPDDFAYVSAGYAPMSVRLVQLLASATGWSSLGETMRLLPGPLIEISQQRGGEEGEELQEALTRSANEATLANNNNTTTTGQLNLMLDEEEKSKRIMLVLVVGGLSFLEVASFRYLSRDPSFPYTIIMATTKMIKSSSFLKQLEHSFL